MDITRRTPDNTAIVLIDYVSGFANLIGSQTIAQNVSGARALTQTALAFGVPLVVSVGPKVDPRGVLYPEVTEVLGNHPVIYRGGSFDAFDYPDFAAAVAATGQRHLVIAGLMTDGCVLQTTLSALRRDYEVSLVVDATACESDTMQHAVVMRLFGLGVTPIGWLSLASELQRTYENRETLADFRAIQANSAGYSKLLSTIGAARTPD